MDETRFPGQIEQGVVCSVLGRTPPAISWRPRSAGSAGLGRFYNSKHPRGTDRASIPSSQSAVWSKSIGNDVQGNTMLKVRLGCRENESKAAGRIYNSVDHLIGVTIEATIDDTDIRPVGPTIFESPLNPRWIFRINIPFNVDPLILLQCQHANRRRSLVQIPVPFHRAISYQRPGSTVKPKLRNHIWIHEGVKHLRHRSTNEQLDFRNNLVVEGHLAYGSFVWHPLI